MKKLLIAFLILCGAGATLVIMADMFAMRVASRLNQPAAASATSPATADNWVDASGAKSQMDDSTVVAYGLAADGPIQGWLESATPRLVVRCREHQTDALVNMGVSPQPELGLFQKNTVQVRFDDAPARSEVWQESTDNKSLFSPTPIHLIREIAKASRLRVQFIPFQSNAAVMTFDVHGFGKRLEALSKACAWKDGE